MPDSVGNITSYAELIDVIVATLVRGDIAADAATWVAATELELFRDCNVTEGDQKLEGTIPAEGDSITLPRGTISVSHITLNISPVQYLKVATLDQITRFREGDNSGVPKFYWRHGRTLELSPAGAEDGTTPYTMWYYGLPQPISEENSSNELSELGWDAYLYGSLMHSAPYIGDDERLQTWAPMYTAKKLSLKNAYWRSRLSGVLETRPDFIVNDRHSRQ